MGKPNPVVLLLGIISVLVICGIIGFLLIDDGKHYYKISFNQQYNTDTSNFGWGFINDLLRLLDDDDLERNDIEIFNDEILKNEDNKFALYFKIKDGEYDDQKVTDKISNGIRFPILAMSVDQIESYELPNTSDDCSNYDESNCGSGKVIRENASSFICAGDNCSGMECCVDEITNPACSTYTCPDGMVSDPDQTTTLCSVSPCGTADTDTCCRSPPGSSSSDNPACSTYT